MLGKELLVEGESIAFPQVLAEPSAGCIPVSPHRVAVAAVSNSIGKAPDVAILVSHPTMCTIIFPCHAFAHLRQIFHPFQHRFVHFTQVGALHQPIVHLGVDVGGVV